MRGWCPPGCARAHGSPRVWELRVRLRAPCALWWEGGPCCNVPVFSDSSVKQWEPGLWEALASGVGVGRMQIMLCTLRWGFRAGLCLCLAKLPGKHQLDFLFPRTRMSGPGDSRTHRPQKEVPLALHSVLASPHFTICPLIPASSLRELFSLRIHLPTKRLGQFKGMGAG